MRGRKLCIIAMQLSLILAEGIPIQTGVNTKQVKAVPNQTDRYNYYLDCYTYGYQGGRGWGGGGGLT